MSKLRVHAPSSLPADLQVLVDRIAPADAVSGQLCPACHGGRTAERSLSVIHTGIFVLLKCHRAGCGYSGATVSPEVGEITVARSFNPRPFYGDLQYPSDALLDLLFSRYELRTGNGPEPRLNRSTVGRFLSEPTAEPEGTALFAHVLDPHGQSRGGIMRFFDGRKPKTLSYLTSAGPHLAWYRHVVPCKFLVIVEDVLSALRCYQLGYDAVALLGTNLNTDKTEEIAARREHSNVLLALDKDAFGKATAYARRWPFLVPVLLEHDIKDSHDDDINKRLQQAAWTANYER